MFNSTYFAPVILETKSGENWLELLPYVFIREGDLDNPTPDKFFIDFDVARNLVDDTIHREVERHELELADNVLALVVRRAMEAANVTNRSSLMHNEIDDPYFAPIVVAHLLFGDRMDSTGVQFIERGRQTFLNVEVALSGFEDGEVEFDAPMAAAWLMPWTLMRQWDFYRPLCAEDLWHWNIAENVVYLLKNQRPAEFDNPVKAYKALRNDNPSRLLFGALMADQMNRPVHEPSNEWDESNTVLDTRVEDLREARRVRAVERFGFTEQDDEWLFECASEPPLSAFGQYGSSENERAAQYVDNVYRPRFRRYDIDSAWALFEAVSRVNREVDSAVEGLQVEAVALSALVSQMAIFALEDWTPANEELRWLAARATPNFQADRLNNFDDTLMDQDYFPMRARQCLQIAEWLIRVTHTHEKYSFFVFDAVEAMTDDELMIVGAFLFMKWENGGVRELLFERYEAPSGFDGTWKQLMAEVGHRGASIDYWRHTPESDDAQAAAVFEALALDGKDQVAWAALDRLEFRGSAAVSERALNPWQAPKALDAIDALSHEIANSVVRHGATVTLVFADGRLNDDSGDVPGGSRFHVTISDGAPQIELEFWDDAPSLAFDRVNKLTERRWVEQAADFSTGSAKLVSPCIYPDENDFGILGSAEKTASALHSELAAAFAHVYEFAGRVNWNAVSLFVDDAEAQVSLGSRLKVLRALSS